MKRIAFYGQYQPLARASAGYTRPYDAGAASPFEAWANHTGHYLGDPLAWSVLLRDTISRLRPDWKVIDRDISDACGTPGMSPDKCRLIQKERRREPVDANLVILGDDRFISMGPRLLPPHRTVILSCLFRLYSYLYYNRQKIGSLRDFAYIFEVSETYAQRLMKMGLTNVKAMRSYRIWRPESLAKVVPRRKMRKCAYYGIFHADSSSGEFIILEAIRIVNSRRDEPIMLDIYGRYFDRDDNPGNLDIIRGDPYIRYMGELDGDTAVGVLAEYDCMLLMTRCLLLYSIMTIVVAAGMPVILSRLIDTNEIIRDGVNGYLVRPGDVEELVDRIERLADDGELLRKMSERNIALYDELYAEEPATRELLEAIDRVMEAKAGG